MPVLEPTLKRAVDLSLRLSPADKLSLIRILSEDVRQELTPRGLGSGSDEECRVTVLPPEKAAQLRASGVLVEPSPQMLARAGAWDALSEAEKREVVEELEGLPSTTSLSEIVVRAREFRSGWDWTFEG